MGRRKKIINNTGIPDFKFEAIARTIFPDILEAWKDEDMQKEFAEWKRQKEYEESMKRKTKKSIA